MPDASGEGSMRPYCFFTNGSWEMAVAVGSVIEVVQPTHLVRLPLCPRQVAGICAYRGGFVVVVGPPSEGEAPSADGDEPVKAVLILRTARGPVGVLVDRCGVAVEEGRGDLDGERPLPGGFVAAGVIGRGGASHCVLDPDRSWLGIRTTIERWYTDALGAYRAEVASITPLGAVGVAVK